MPIRNLAGATGTTTPAAQSATVGAGTTDALYIVSRALGSASTLALIGGTNGNLTLSGSSIAASAAIGAGTSQVAVVREVSGLLAIEYPVTLSAAAAPAAFDGYDVIVLAGQSNMIGRNGPVDATLDATDPPIVQYGFDAQAVAPASNPLDHQDETADTVGLGLSFARQYLPTIAAGRKVLLVPVAKGGTGFTGGFWRTSGGGDAPAIARTNAAMAQGAGSNRLVAILWHQGESDQTFTQVQYETDLDALIARWRSSMTGASAATPFICGGLLAGGAQTGAGVSAALAATPGRTSYTGFASSAGLAGGSDNLHFDAASQRTLGGRYFSAYQSAATNVVAPTAPAGGGGGTNLLTQPQDFGAWTTNGETTVAANVAANPVSGATNADRITQVAGTTKHSLTTPASQGSVTSGQTYTYAFDVKSETQPCVQLFVSGSVASSQPYADFDLAAGSVGVSVNCTPAVVDLGGGWKRVSITFAASGSAAFAGVIALVANSAVGRGGADAVTAGSERSLLLCNAQLVLGPTANAY